MRMNETHAHSDSIYQSQVPSVEDLCDALAQLDHRYATTKAAVHLATPVDVVLGMGVSSTRFTVEYRGEAVVIPYHLDLTEAAERLHGLILRGHRTADRYLDLTAEPAHWLKTMRSGAHWYVFGANVLFGLPHIRLFMPPTEGLVSVLLEGAGHSGVYSVGAERYLVDGDDRIIEVRRLRPVKELEPVPLSDPDDAVQRLQHRLEELLGEEGRILNVTVFPDRIPGVTEVEYVFAFRQYQLIIPAAVATSGWVVGAQHANTLPSTPATHDGASSEFGPVPDGWDPIEPARWEPGTVARHTESGITAICRPL